MEGLDHISIHVIIYNIIQGCEEIEGLDQAEVNCSRASPFQARQEGCDDKPCVSTNAVLVFVLVVISDHEPCISSHVALVFVRGGNIRDRIFD